MSMMEERDYRVSPELRTRRFEKVFLPEMEIMPRSRKPVSLFLGAQPGAGKTRVAGLIAERYGELYRIDPDSIRETHPDYNMLASTKPDDMPELTNPYVNGMINRIIKYCGRNGVSYEFENTWHPADRTLDRIGGEHSIGRRTIAVALSVPPALSVAGALQRYLIAKSRGYAARWTGLSYLKETNARIRDDVRAVAGSPFLDGFMVADRSGIITTDDTAQALEKWDDEHSRPLTPSERALVGKILDSGKELLSESDVPSDLVMLLQVLESYGPSSDNFLGKTHQPPVIGPVHPGAFCSTTSPGVTAKGTRMTCAPCSDGRNRWRRA